MTFDKAICKTIGKEKIEYGFIKGNEKIVFIKSGAYGSIEGSGNKYLKMAHKLHERLGATVICASNPEVEHKHLDEKAIRSIASQLKFPTFELYFVGASDGGYHNLILASKFVETVKVLGINSSFIDAQDLREKIENIPFADKIFVYGTKDEDYNDIVPALRKIKSDKLSFCS